MQRLCTGYTICILVITLVCGISFEVYSSNSLIKVQNNNILNYYTVLELINRKYWLKMTYLEGVSNEVFEDHVKWLLSKMEEIDSSYSPRTFYKNVVDPFSAIFESSHMDRTFEDWRISEKKRQLQKSYSSHYGKFHEMVLGSFPEWQQLPVGEQIDLISSKKRVIAEIKNKHNTVKGSDQVSIYETLSDLVNLKSSKYYKWTAYYVTIIPLARYKNKIIPFTPSDKKKGINCPPDEKIHQIDGNAFYALVSGKPKTLMDVFIGLNAILNKLGYKAVGKDLPNYHDLFDRAFVKI